MVAQHPAEDPAVGTTVSERMVALAYRVVRELGHSRRASVRLCRQILLATPSWSVQQGQVEAAAVGTDAESARRTRAGLLAVIRTEIGPRVDRARLERALAAAVLADELALLPPRQQAAVRWAVQERCSIEQIAERTGWRPQQVACLLRAGLATLTARA